MKIVVNPKYSFLIEFINQLPESFTSKGEIVYSGRNVLKHYQIQETDIVVKSFKIPIFINKVIYTFFRKSKACRSYKYAMEIIRRGANTPEPIAYIEEYRKGLLCSSFFISKYNTEAVTMRSYMDGSNLQADDVLREFVQFTADLHRKEILHIDYSPGNILMNTSQDGNYSFSIIDINRLSFKKVSKKEAYRNFDRLAYSVEISTRLARMYADYCGLNQDEAINSINTYSDVFFKKLTFKLLRRSFREDRKDEAALFGPISKYRFLCLLNDLFGIKYRNRYLYQREYELYKTYVKNADLRKVLGRRYQE